MALWKTLPFFIACLALVTAMAISSEDAELRWKPECWMFVLRQLVHEGYSDVIDKTMVIIYRERISKILYELVETSVQLILLFSSSVVYV